MTDISSVSFDRNAGDCIITCTLVNNTDIKWIPVSPKPTFRGSASTSRFTLNPEIVNPRSIGVAGQLQGNINTSRMMGIIAYRCTVDPSRNMVLYIEQLPGGRGKPQVTFLPDKVDEELLKLMMESKDVGETADITLEIGGEKLNIHVTAQMNHGFNVHARFTLTYV
ncbi:hypothetical protein L218DRAFT_990288 [Marasmius fiardii PR-910]|nr:hypothetical protein L218DRAFT_990288 [Marasmius fiardii PR-910]